jgi:hypothetical protein
MMKRRLATVIRFADLEDGQSVFPCAIELGSVDGRR